jgi:cyclic-di-AMP phosphodiesterase PgpH
MSLRNHLRLVMGGLSARRGAAGIGAAAAREFLDRSLLVSGLIFVATVAAIVAISSAGMTFINLPVLPNQIASVRVVARAPFSFVSDERTHALREQIADRTPPVYRLDLEPLRQFEKTARLVLDRLSEFESGRVSGATEFAGRRDSLAAIADGINAAGPYRISPEDLEAVLDAGDARTRASLFETGLAALREICNEGVHDSSFGGGGEGLAISLVARANGEVVQRPVQSLEDALTFLRVSLSVGGVRPETAQALFHFFRNGVAPNLVYDRAATERRIAQAQRAARPVTVDVTPGQIIVEAGDRVTPEQYEMFMRHQEYLSRHGDTGVVGTLLHFGHVLLVLAMVLASLVYIRLEDPETLRSNMRLALLALVVIVNLAIVRMVYSLGGMDFFVSDGSWASALPYVAPTALAPIIVAILIDTGSAIFMALLISIFTGVIYGSRLDLLVLNFLASMVAVYFCRDARRRSLVVSAGGAGGLTMAAFGALIGIANQTPVDTLAREMTAGVVTGLLTGVVVVGLLPILESVFKRTTDITLLELTDYNHPLLRRMQLEAPGTYHHSIVVAQLAENACSAIGANPLLARVCALFHDIGKTANPGYFTENQRDRRNPHDGLEPAESARIIRRHVPDGLEMARRHRMPRAVTDVISQHHGTTLVKVFFMRAEAAAQAAGGHVDEAPYRYTGPKPRFRESAVISLADAAEAATRSLRSATAQQLGELIDAIVGNRIAEGELNEAPLTLEDIAKVKESFIFTLLNMLHGRVSYAEAADPGRGGNPGGTPPKTRAGL